jgi:hypothetical protein
MWHGVLVLDGKGVTEADNQRRGEELRVLTPRDPRGGAGRDRVPVHDPGRQFFDFLSATTATACSGNQAHDKKENSALHFFGRSTSTARLR